jgi:two-component system, cell cycle sensor histidine kinase and response regulator CckA
MESVGQLAAGIAHDFNNTLGAIAGFAELIKDGEDPGDASDDAQQILAAVDRASRLTRDLLLVGRRAVTRPQHADLNTVVTGVRALLGASLGANITLAVNLRTGLPVVWVDPGQVERAILNIAVNVRLHPARRPSPPGVLHPQAFHRRAAADEDPRPPRPAARP